MINAFKRSKIMAFYIGIPLAIITFSLIWSMTGTRISTTSMRVLVSISLAVFMFSVVFLVSRGMATRDYQRLLPVFYFELDPQKMIDNLDALNEKGLNADEKAATDLHKASAYIYLGETAKAQSFLEGIDVPPHDIDTKFLIYGNLATCALMADDRHNAKKYIENLNALVKNKKCNQNLAVRIDRVSGYLHMCLDIQRGKEVDISIMEDDFENSTVPTHKLDVAYYILMYRYKKGESEKSSKYADFINEQGKKTIYPFKVSMIYNLS